MSFDMDKVDFESVCAVAVTYRPDIEVLRGLLNAIAPQVGSVVVVDNTGGNDVRIDEIIDHASIHLLPQFSNVGLAQAQNVGIAWAREHGYSHVLLLDQDSTPDSTMVAALLEALARLSATKQVAAVGPRFHDLHEHRDAPFVRIGFPWNRKYWCTHATETVECDFLISSGALIPLQVIDKVGALDASLFIDNVDLEWSFRARAQGYTLHGICAAHMSHRLGDSRRSLALGMGRVVVHGPVRLYYMMRNRTRLYRMQHTPRVWIAQDLPRVFFKLFLFGVLIGPRQRNLACMLRGLTDGLRGREGAAPPGLI
jgi:rhamnosyltransferase